VAGMNDVETAVRENDLFPGRAKDLKKGLKLLDGFYLGDHSN
jgi:hypothetical protein